MPSPVRITRRHAIASLAAAVGLAGKGRAASNPVVERLRERAAMGHTRFKLLAPSGSDQSIFAVARQLYDQTGITLEPTFVGIHDIGTELTLRQIIGDVRYDIALPATHDLATLVANGMIQPVPSSRHVLPQSDQPLFDHGTHWRGQRYGYQTDGDVFLGFYNSRFRTDPVLKATYEDTMGRVFQTPKSWAELDQQIRFFHDPSQGRYGAIFARTPDHVIWEWWLRLHAKGIWPLDASMQPQVAGEDGVTALEELIRITECVPPGHGRMPFGRAMETYAQGESYFALGWGGYQKRLFGQGTPMHGQVFAAPPPGLDSGALDAMAFFNWGWTYAVTSVTEDAETAFLISQFAVSSVVSTRAIRETNGFIDPFLESHFTDPGIVRAYGQQYLDVQRDALKSAFPVLTIPGARDYLDVLGKGIDHALRGMLSPEIALARVADEWSLLTEQIGRDEQIKYWSEVRARYPRALASHLL